MEAQVPGAGPWCRCTWRKGLRARRPRPARKPPGEPAEPRGPGAQAPGPAGLCSVAASSLRYVFLFFFLNSQPNQKLN